jgi:hypothetical protein
MPATVGPIDLPGLVAGMSLTRLVAAAPPQSILDAIGRTPMIPTTVCITCTTVSMSAAFPKSIA